MLQVLDLNHEAHEGHEDHEGNFMEEPFVSFVFFVVKNLNAEIRRSGVTGSLLRISDTSRFSGCPHRGLRRGRFRGHDIFNHEDTKALRFH
jgi:hypothetical protein